MTDMTDTELDLDGLAGSLRADGYAWESSLSDMGPFETLNLTHAQVDSYAKTFFAAADEIEAQRDRADGLELFRRNVFAAVGAFRDEMISEETAFERIEALYDAVVLNGGDDE